jgi:diguanylate cyclase (GGDEF)-like protein
VTLTLLLTWFPIILTVGLGGKMLGRTRGYCLGALAALFWIALSQASLGAVIWQSAWTAATLLTGFAAIVAIGGWAGETPQSPSAPGRGSAAVAGGLATSGPDTWAKDRAVTLEKLIQCFDEFDDWLERHGNANDPWPKFDEFLRAALYRCCQATHARPYRILPESEPLVPLREPDPFRAAKPLSTGAGVIGQVVASGRSYLAMDHSAPAASASPENGDGAIAWCFPIRRGARTLGVIVVGRVGISPLAHRELFATVERLAQQFWCTLEAVHQARTAVLDDPVSGLHTREAFLRVAEEALTDSYRLDEPVALLVLALEGLRELNDAARWEMADELVREVGRSLRHKVRQDDRLGRFDGSRFLVLLRRVDAQLAGLIVAQMAERVRRVCGDEQRWGRSVGVRCGVAGSGNDQPPLRSLVSKALVQWQRARTEGLAIAADLPEIHEPAPPTNAEVGVPDESRVTVA